MRNRNPRRAWVEVTTTGGLVTVTLHHCNSHRRQAVRSAVERSIGSRATVSFASNPPVGTAALQCEVQTESARYPGSAPEQVRKLALSAVENVPGVSIGNPAANKVIQTSVGRRQTGRAHGRRSLSLSPAFR
jgi:hypothetical protein